MSDEIIARLLALEAKCKELEDDSEIRDDEIGESQAKIVELEAQVNFLVERDRVIFPIASQVVESMIYNLNTTRRDACAVFMSKYRMNSIELYSCVASGCYIPLGAGYKMALNGAGVIFATLDVVE